MPEEMMHNRLKDGGVMINAATGCDAAEHAGITLWSP
jgi:hypothetical protein